MFLTQQVGAVISACVLKWFCNELCGYFLFNKLQFIEELRNTPLGVK